MCRYLLKLNTHICHCVGPAPVCRQIHSLLSPDVLSFVAGWLLQVPVSGSYVSWLPVRFSQWKAMEGAWKEGGKKKPGYFSTSTLLCSHSHPFLSLGSIPCHGYSSYMGPAHTGGARHNSIFSRWPFSLYLVTLTLFASSPRSDNSFLLLFICGLPHPLLLGYSAI